MEMEAGRVGAGPQGLCLEFAPSLRAVGSHERLKQGGEERVM